MKRFCLILLSLFLTAVSLSAQTVVNGIVQSKDGNYLSGVSIQTPEGKVLCTSDETGRFSATVPFGTRSLQAVMEGYITVSKEVDGSLMLFNMVVDNNYYAKKERQRIEAEKAAMAAAAVEAAAIQKAAIEAAEKAKAEAAAAQKAEADRLAAEERARREAEAKAKAEAAAAQKAEADRLAAQEKARKDAEAKAKREETARKDADYEKKFKNKGLSHTIDFSYAYQLNTGSIVYTHSGYREYGNLSPMQLTYTLSYKFNRWISLGIGAGVLFNAKSITIVNDEFYGNPDFSEKRVDIPLFINFKTYFLRSKCRPFISLDGGYYLLSGVVMWDGGAGCEFRLNRKLSLQVQAMVSGVPWPSFAASPAKYNSVIAPGFKVGFSF